MSGLEWVSLTRALSDTLLQLLWQLGLLGAAAALALRLLRGQTAQARYALCAAALLASLLLAGLQLRANWPDATDTEPALPPTTAALMAPAVAPGAPAPAMVATPAPTPADASAWRSGVVAAWLAGCAAMWLRLLAGLACVLRWRRVAQAAPAALQRRADRLAAALGLRRPVPLRLLPAGWGDSPFTVGWWRPVVLLPVSLLSGLPAPLLEALLAHELAHVRRWDYLVNGLQLVVEALLFFHPVVWWLSRRLRVERELVADAIAATQLASPRDLALALKALADAAAPRPATAGLPALAHAAGGGELLARVQALLRRPAPGPAHPLLPALLALGPLLLVLGLLNPPGAATAVADELLPRLAEPARPQPPQAGALPVDLALSSPHVLVSDAATGAVLLQRRADEAVPAASLSKLMTALVVLASGQDLQQPLQLSREDQLALGDSSAGLRPGQRLTREDALTLMLQASDNRAAMLLARHYPGGLVGFAQASDAMAQRLGLQQASLHHPSGASEANRASAQDLARLLAAAAAQPLILRAAGTARQPVTVDGRVRDSRSTLRELGQPDWPILLAKTGSSRSAGRCVALQMRVQGRLVSVVLMGAPGLREREADLQRIRDALQT